MKHKHLGGVLALAVAAWLAWRYILKPKAPAGSQGTTSGVYVPGGSDAAAQLVGTTMALNPNNPTGLNDALGGGTANPPRPILLPTGAGSGSWGGAFGDGAGTGAFRGGPVPGGPMRGYFP